MDILMPLSGASPLILFICRVVLGSVMIYYGSFKIKDLAQNAKDFENMGFKPGMFWGTIVALVEFGGGSLMVLGMFSGLFALLFGITMLGGTIWKMTKSDKPFSDYSYDIILLCLCLVIMTFGAGEFAIETLIF